MNARQLMAGKTWNIAQIRGHEIEVSPWFLGILAFFVLAGLGDFNRIFHQLMWVPVLFLSILLHELGHAAATKKCGFGTSKIILHGFGGVAINRRSRTKPNDGMFIALAGPAVTLALALVFGGLHFGFGALTAGSVPTGVDVIGHFLGLMVLANLFWFVLNMLPIFPLDGGQTLMHFFRKKGSTQSKATAKAAKISLGTIAVVALLTLLVFQVGGILILIIFGYLGYMNWQVLQRAQQGGGPGGPGGGMGMMRFRR